MTTQQLILPITLTRGKSLITFLYMYFFESMVIVPCIIIFVFPLGLESISLDKSTLQLVLFLNTALFVVANLIGVAFIIKRIKPESICIKRTDITVTPTPFLGFKYGEERSYSPSSFVSIDLVKNEVRGVTLYRMYLRSNDGKNDIMVDDLRKINAPQLAEQLATALNLKANINA